MARYIDADNIDYTKTMVGRDEYAGHRTVAFKSDIDAMPTADVVKVVRCKDCKWSSKMVGGEYSCIVDHRLSHEENDFCSYGERKE